MKSTWAKISILCLVVVHLTTCKSRPSSDLRGAEEYASTTPEQLAERLKAVLGGLENYRIMRNTLFMAMQTVKLEQRPLSPEMQNKLTAGLPLDAEQLQELKILLGSLSVENLDGIQFALSRPQLQNQFGDVALTMTYRNGSSNVEFGIDGEETETAKIALDMVQKPYLPKTLQTAIKMVGRSVREDLVRSLSLPDDGLVAVFERERHETDGSYSSNFDTFLAARISHQLVLKDDIIENLKIVASKTAKVRWSSEHSMHFYQTATDWLPVLYLKKAAEISPQIFKEAVTSLSPELLQHHFSDENTADPQSRLTILSQLSTIHKLDILAMISFTLPSSIKFNPSPIGKAIFSTYRRLIGLQNDGKILSVIQPTDLREARFLYVCEQPPFRFRMNDPNFHEYRGSVHSNLLSTEIFDLAAIEDLNRQDIEVQCGNKRFQIKMSRSAGSHVLPNPKPEVISASGKTINVSTIVTLVDESNLSGIAGAITYLMANGFKPMSLTIVKDINAEFSSIFREQLDVLILAAHIYEVDRFGLGVEQPIKINFRGVRNGRNVNLTVYIPPPAPNGKDRHAAYTLSSKLGFPSAAKVLIQGMLAAIENFGANSSRRIVNLSSQQLSELFCQRRSKGVGPLAVMNVACDGSKTIDAWMLAYKASVNFENKKWKNDIKNEVPTIIAADRGFNTENNASLLSHMRYPIILIDQIAKNGKIDPIMQALTYPSSKTLVDKYLDIIVRNTSEGYGSEEGFKPITNAASFAYTLEVGGTVNVNIQPSN